MSQLQRGNRISLIQIIRRRFPNLAKLPYEVVEERINGRREGIMPANQRIKNRMAKLEKQKQEHEKTDPFFVFYDKLKQSVEKGDLEGVRNLLDGEIPTKDEKGRDWLVYLPLMIAVREDHREIAELIYERIDFSDNPERSDLFKTVGNFLGTTDPAPIQDIEPEEEYLPLKHPPIKKRFKNALLAVAMVMGLGTVGYLGNDYYQLWRAKEVVHSLLHTNDQTKIKKNTRYFIKALESGEWHTRRLAAQFLGKTKDPSVIKTLIGLLDDDVQYVQEAAALSLMELGHPKVVDILIVKLRDSREFWRRRSAVITLGKLGNPKAIKPLIKTLEDQDLEVAVKTAKAIGEIAEKTRNFSLMKPAIKPLNKLYGKVHSYRVLDAIEIIKSLKQEIHGIKKTVVELAPEKNQFEKTKPKRTKKIKPTKRPERDPETKKKQVAAPIPKEKTPPGIESPEVLLRSGRVVVYGMNHHSVGGSKHLLRSNGIKFDYRHLGSHAKPTVYVDELRKLVAHMEKLSPAQSKSRRIRLPFIVINGSTVEGKLETKLKRTIELMKSGKKYEAKDPKPESATALLRAGRIIVYGAPWCHPCKLLKYYLKAKKVSFEYRDISAYEAYNKELDVLKARKALPIMVVHGRLFSTYALSKTTLDKKSQRYKLDVLFDCLKSGKKIDSCMKRAKSKGF
jgi:glutaredoxin